MQLVTYSKGDERQYLGVLLDNGKRVMELAKAWVITYNKTNPVLESMLSLIHAGAPGLDDVKRLLDLNPLDAVKDLDSVRLLPPIPCPPQIRDCLCFEEHLVRAYEVLRQVRANAEADPEEALREYERRGLFRVPDVWYQQPIYYKGNRFSVIGTGEDVHWPAYAEKLDFELEFGFFIGKSGRNISKSEAGNHIFGYTIFNDISARDTQTVEMPGLLGPAKSKDFDTGNVMGPCITTADEIDPYDLTMIARVNGEEWCRNSSSTIHWSFEDLISYTSQSETLHCGEFFGSGTVGGGSGLELQRFLNPGDLIELEVEGIGILRNRIVRSPDRQRQQ